MNTSSAVTGLSASKTGMLLDMMRDLLAQYVDLEDKQVTASTTLIDLGVDSLTAAEVLFALEDRLGVRMQEPAQVPVTVGDVMDYALPYLESTPSLGPH